MSRITSNVSTDCKIPRRQPTRGRWHRVHWSPLIAYRSLFSCLFWIIGLFLLSSPRIPAQILPFWTTPVPLDTSIHLSTEPTIASLGQGIFAVWSDDRVGNQELFLRHSPDGGHRWMPEERLTTTESDSIQPSLANDPQYLHLVWIEQTTTSQRLWYQRGNGNEWEPPRPLSVASARAQRPQIAVTTSYPQFSIYVVWEEQTAQKITAMIRVSHDGGLTWDIPRAITEGDWDTSGPQVAAGPKVAYLVWRDRRDATDQIFFKRWGDYQLDPDMRIYPFGGCRRPTIAVMNEQIAIAWERHDTVNAQVSIATIQSQDGARTWSDVQTITQGSAEAIRPSIRIASGTAWLFWQDGREGQWTIYAAQKQVRDRQWSQPMRFIEMPSDSFQPTFATSMGNPEDQLHLVWFTRSAPQTSTVYYSRRDTVPPPLPDRPEHTDLSASPGYDDDGELTFFWPYPSENPPIEYRIYVSEDEGPFQIWHPGYTVTHPPINYPGQNGHRYRIALESLDAVGNISERSAPSTPVMVDNQKPRTEIHIPLAKTTLMAKTSVAITCTDEYLLSWQLMFGETENPSTWIMLADPGRTSVESFTAATWDLRALRGIYTLRLIAQDQAGNQSETRIQISVDNLPPLPLLADNQELLLQNTTDAFYRQPRWSLDDRIAYVSNVGGATDIWQMGLHERIPQRITRDTYPDASPDWSPDGQVLVFESFRNQRWEIWGSSSDGVDRWPLIADGYMNRYPTWSPNGHQLAFASDRDGDYEIWLLANVDEVVQGASPELVRVTDNRWDDLHPSWSPNGTELVFQSRRSNNWDLFRIQTDGTQERRLTAELSDEIQPRWAPSGKQILFQSDREQDPRSNAPDSYVLNIISDGVSMVSEDTFDADWSPNLDALIQQSPNGIALVGLTSPMEPLEARMSRPYQGEYVRDGADIIGIARGRDFLRYQLEYRSRRPSAAAGSRDEKSQSPWQSLGGIATAPVIRTGFLGALDTSTFEGIYEIRLSVIGRDGMIVQDTVEILTGQETPGLLLSEPPEGLQTTDSRILVVGRADANAQVWVNEELLSSGHPVLSSASVRRQSEFRTWVALSPGENIISIRARDALGFESRVTRRVTLDRTMPEISLDSPQDFETTLVPYTQVVGQVNVPATVSIESNRVELPDTSVPLREDQTFQRQILLRDGTNVLTIQAVDRLGREEQVRRRVIYQAQEVILEDVTPPAAVNIYPLDGQVIHSRQVELKATLVDDVALDPETIHLEFNDEEILDTMFEFDEETGLLRYRVPEELTDGDYRFRIRMADKTGHETVVDIAFTVDTAPLYAGLTAKLESERMRLILASNRLLRSNPGVDLFVEPTEHAYSLTLDHTGDSPDLFSALFDLTPSQRAFRLRSSVVTATGESLLLHGYLAYGMLYPGGSLTLPDLSGGSEFIPNFQVALDDSETTLREPVLVSLRSQDPLDMERLAAQNLDVESRQLELYDIAYDISTDPLPAEGTEDSTGPLRIRALAPVDLPLALFYWNARLQRWDPLEEQQRQGTSFYEGTAQKLGSYALLYDREPPIIENLSPRDREEVPLDRFLVEADLRDEGSGVAQIAVYVDTRLSSFEYDPETEHLIYLPSELSPGLHTLKIQVTDRANNEASLTSIFFTRDVFEFADPVIAYPNPAREQVTVRFKLTRLATVTMQVFDVSGSMIYTDTLINVAGRGDLKEQFIWDLHNTAGQPIAAGVYIYQLEATQGEQTIRQDGKIAIVR